MDYLDIKEEVYALDLPTLNAEYQRTKFGRSVGNRSREGKICAVALRRYAESTNASPDSLPLSLSECNSYFEITNGENAPMFENLRHFEALKAGVYARYPEHTLALDQIFGHTYDGPEIEQLRRAMCHPSTLYLQNLYNITNSNVMSMFGPEDIESDHPHGIEKVYRYGKIPKILHSVPGIIRDMWDDLEYIVYDVIPGISREIIEDDMDEISDQLWTMGGHWDRNGSWVWDANTRHRRRPRRRPRASASASAAYPDSEEDVHVPKTLIRRRVNAEDAHATLPARRSEAASNSDSDSDAPVTLPARRGNAAPVSDLDSDSDAHVTRPARRGDAAPAPASASASASAAGSSSDDAAYVTSPARHVYAVRRGNAAPVSDLDSYSDLDSNAPVNRPARRGIAVPVLDLDSDSDLDSDAPVNRPARRGIAVPVLDLDSDLDSDLDLDSDAPARRGDAVPPHLDYSAIREEVRALDDAALNAEYQITRFGRNVENRSRDGKIKAVTLRRFAESPENLLPGIEHTAYFCMTEGQPAAHFLDEDGDEDSGIMSRQTWDSIKAKMHALYPLHTVAIDQIFSPEYQGEDEEGIFTPEVSRLRDAMTHPKEDRRRGLYQITNSNGMSMFGPEDIEADYPRGIEKVSRYGVIPLHAVHYFYRGIGRHEHGVEDVIDVIVSAIPGLTLEMIRADSAAIEDEGGNRYIPDADSDEMPQAPPSRRLIHDSSTDSEEMPARPSRRTRVLSSGSEGDTVRMPRNADDSEPEFVPHPASFAKRNISKYGLEQPSRVSFKAPKQQSFQHFEKMATRTCEVKPDLCRFNAHSLSSDTQELLADALNTMRDFCLSERNRQRTDYLFLEMVAVPRRGGTISINWNDKQGQPKPPKYFAKAAIYWLNKPDDVVRSPAFSIRDQPAVDLGGVTATVYYKAGEYIKSLLAMGDNGYYYTKDTDLEVPVSLTDIIACSILTDNTIGVPLSRAFLYYIREGAIPRDEMSLGVLLSLYKMDTSNEELSQILAYLDDEYWTGEDSLLEHEFTTQTLTGLAGRTEITHAQRLEWLRRYIYDKLYGDMTDDLIFRRENRLKLSPIWRVIDNLSLETLGRLLGTRIDKDTIMQMMMTAITESDPDSHSRSRSRSRSPYDTLREYMKKFIQETTVRDWEGLLIFATGKVDPSSRIRFNIYQYRKKLPVAHTCDKTVDLCAYTDYEMFKEHMLIAIASNESGFAFG